ncbi:hypothetical protein H6G76_10595 [Nostoc sp. FACHB-152]|nr:MULTISPECIES: hypothetical protein [unclassified Nostoc]MBD2447612.1 hypothetical protein [Nostoc sp. FACHB-152]MBD2470603.1 hypothetical protein [Nostoc sp. FACHB-145]
MAVTCSLFLSLFIQDGEVRSPDYLSNSGVSTVAYGSFILQYVNFTA